MHWQSDALTTRLDLIRNVLTSAGLPALAGVSYIAGIPALACIIAVVGVPSVSYVPAVAGCNRADDFFILTDYLTIYYRNSEYEKQSDSLISD